MPVGASSCSEVPSVRTTSAWCRSLSTATVARSFTDTRVKGIVVWNSDGCNFDVTAAERRLYAASMTRQESSLEACPAGSTRIPSIYAAVGMS